LRSYKNQNKKDKGDRKQRPSPRGNQLSLALEKRDIVQGGVSVLGRHITPHKLRITEPVLTAGTKDLSPASVRDGSSTSRRDEGEYPFSVTVWRQTSRTGPGKSTGKATQPWTCPVGSKALGDFVGASRPSFNKRHDEGNCKCLWVGGVGDSQKEGKEMIGP